VLLLVLATYRSKKRENILAQTVSRQKNNPTLDIKCFLVCAKFVVCFSEGKIADTHKKLFFLFFLALGYVFHQSFEKLFLFSFVAFDKLFLLYYAHLNVSSSQWNRM